MRFSTPKVLLFVYVLLFVALAFDPTHRVTWWSENITVLIIVGSLVVMWFRGVRFSDTAYQLMSVLIFMHTIGGHYTFELVPFDWFSNLFGFERNHYDRIAHFTVGFYAYAIAEYLSMKKLVANKFLLFTYPIFTIVTVAAVYEMIEWTYAANMASEAGLAYLGSQGDIWDAQKDMLADTLGAVTAMIGFMAMRKKKE